MNNDTSSNNMNKLFIGLIIFIALGLIGSLLNKTDHDDGKCDICNKKATYTTSAEEYCDKHLENAVNWHIKQKNNE